MKSPEQFNPKNEEYQKVEDLPEGYQKDFVNVEGGFVRKEAAEELSDAELTAEIANTLKSQGITSLDVLHERASGKKRGYEMYNAPKELLADKEFVLECVKEWGHSLIYAPKKFQQDKEVVLEAVKNNPEAIKYASDSIRGEIEELLKKK